jgi:hypothetical protein
VRTIPGARPGVGLVPRIGIHMDDVCALIETAGRLYARTVTDWASEVEMAVAGLETGGTITYVSGANRRGRAVTVSLEVNGQLRVTAADRHGQRAVVLHDQRSASQVLRFASRWLPVDVVLTLPIVGFRAVDAEG